MNELSLMSTNYTNVYRPEDEENPANTMVNLFLTCIATFALALIIYKASSSFDWSRFSFVGSNKKERDALSQKTLREVEPMLLEKGAENNTENLQECFKSQFQHLIHTINDSSCSDHWQDETVEEAADKLISLAYAYSVSFIEEGTLNKMDQTKNSEILFYLPLVYHALRGRAYTREKEPHCDGNDTDTTRICLSVNEDPISSEYSELFYKKGTRQNEWRLLSLDYRYKLTEKKSEKELRAIDPRIMNWIKKDLSPKNFVSKPDTLPNVDILYV
jgi:hypothetical protein